MSTCIIPGCKRPTNGCRMCFHHHVQGAENYNTIPMNPQPLRELAEVTSDSSGRWGTFVRGKGMAEPFLNQPPNVCGVKKDGGVWYWLLDS